MIVERPKAFIPTEDQGYLIVRRPDARRHQRRADQPGRPARRRRSPGELHGRPRRARSSTATTPITATNQTNTATSFVILEEWHAPDDARAAGRRPGRRAPGAGSPRRSATPRVVVLQPPPIRGLSRPAASSFMIEDREGKGVEATASRSPTGSWTRPASGPSWPASSRPSRPGCPSSGSTSTGPRPAASTCRSPTSSASSRPTSAATTSTTSTSTARSGRSWSRPRAASGTGPRTSQNLYVLNRKGERVPLSSLGEVQLRARADRRAALQPVHRRQDQRPARPGLQLGPGDRRDAGGRRRGPARGVRLRVDRHDLPGAEDRQPGDLHLRPVGRLRLPVHGGPLRELDPARWSSS